MTLVNISTDWMNSCSNWPWVAVLQSQPGFCCTQVPRCVNAIGNGAPVVVGPVVTVPARPPNDVPGVRPYHMKSPVPVRGPARIRATIAASCAVMVPQGRTLPTCVRGSKAHRDGSPITPSATPSPTLSQAWIAAAWNALNLHCGRKLPSLEHDQLGPELGRDEPRPVDGRRGRQDPVVVVRVALRLGQALTPAGRAAVEVGVAGRPSVEGGGDRLADHGHVVDAQIRVVADELPVEAVVGVEGERTAPADVSGVGRAGGVALPDRCGQRLRAAAGVATAPDALEPAVPSGRPASRCRC